MRMYLAGKITGTTWRDEILRDGLSAAIAQSVEEIEEAAGFPTRPRAIEAADEWFDYAGPYFVSPNWGHGHRLDTDEDHGISLTRWSEALDYDDGHGGVIDDAAKYRIVTECLQAIISSTVVFAWIDRTDIYGTLAEIGFARAHGKPVWIGWKAQPESEADDAESVNELRRALWFIDELGSGSFEAESPRDALNELSARWMYRLLNTIPYEEYLTSSHWQRMREKALEYAEDRCQLCYTDEDLAVHHRTYERRGHERLSDLTVLCKKCHSEFHKIVNGKPTRMPVTR